MIKIIDRINLIFSFSLRKEVWGGKEPPDFLEFLKKGIKEGRYNKAIFERFTNEEISSFGQYIKHDRDFLFRYSGLLQCVDKYLVKNVVNKQTYETPNLAYMLLAMTAFSEDKGRIKKAYDGYSLHKISLPTPIFAGLRTNFDSFASCGLIDVGDSVDQICAAFEATAKATAKRYGIGLDFSRMRSLKAPIRGGEATHTGKVAFLRVIQDTIKSWMQTSTRSGAATITIPIWDYEIEEIIQLKDPLRTSETRISEIDYSVAFSKLFYQRFKDDGIITLFSSHEVPALVNSYGLPEFDDLYLKAESDPRIKMKKQVSARELFKLFNKYRVETGMLYIFNIDSANSHSTFKKRVSMFNLCQEVGYAMEPIEHLHDENSTIGVCNLGAINVANIKSDEDLEECCDIVVRKLDWIITNQSYFSKAAERFAKNYRSLGIGFTNLAGWLAKKGLKYSSVEARTEVHKLTEKFQFYLLKASNQLAKEKGKCEWYDQTKFADGLLNIDTYNKRVDSCVDPTLYQDWAWLRKEIAEHGLRNSTLTAQMPCEASALCTNSTNGIERPRSKVVLKSNKGKDLPVVTPNFWKWKYEYAFENIDNEQHIQMMAVIQKFFCMSISTNLYYNYGLYADGNVSSDIIDADMFKAYSYGLKTVYYTNSDDGNKHGLKDDGGGCESGACKL